MDSESLGEWICLPRQGHPRHTRSHAWSMAGEACNSHGFEAVGSESAYGPASRGVFCVYMHALRMRGVCASHPTGYLEAELLSELDDVAGWRRQRREPW